MDFTPHQGRGLAVESNGDSGRRSDDAIAPQTESHETAESDESVMAYPQFAWYGYRDITTK